MSADAAIRPHASGCPVERVVRLLVLASLLLFVGLRWDPALGFTDMVRFGEKNAASRLPQLKDRPIAEARDYGYDGQFYAQLAVNPAVTDDAVIRAMDKPSYRTRRILLPLIAHVLGGGQVWWALQIYALLNTVAWVWLAVVLGRLLPVGNWRATAAWLGVMLSVGTLDSVRQTLTDLPAALLLVLAVRAMEAGRPRVAAAWCLVAGFVREVSLAGALLVRSTAPTEPAWANRRQTFLLRTACTAPVLAWCAWLAWRLPGTMGHEGNFDWPGFAFARQLWSDVGNAIQSGHVNEQAFFNFFGGIGLAAQSLYVLGQWRGFAANPWVRLGVPFAVLFWILGADPWLDYRPLARDCLPMTIVFNVLWFRRASSSRCWWLANVTIVDGLLRITNP